MLKSVIIVLVIASIVIGIDQAQGFIEIKKYKTINSAKVCGDKMCSVIDEQRAKNGLSSHNTKVCGDKPCYKIVTEISSINKSTPLGQFRLGSTFDMIQCKELHALVIKTTNIIPACVKVENVEKLRHRNWAISETKQQEVIKKFENKKTEIIKSKTNKDFEVLLNIKFEQIYNQRYIMFEGDGWHGFHNVEITISGDNFSESLLTKTDKNGHLNMPWPIPDTLGGRKYHIFATDKIHEFEMNIPIIR